MQTSEASIAIHMYQPADFELLRGFVESIQEYERAYVPELKPGVEIGDDYARMLTDVVVDRERQGLILIARRDDVAVGFACAWIAVDDDALLQDDARKHAYVSDIFVEDACCGQGVARLLLQEIESEMRRRGCVRIRICTRATNRSALKCYETNGYRPYEIILSKPLAD